MIKLTDTDIKNKIIIIRCDFNVPIENNLIIDDTRIVMSLRTIKYALKRAKKVILLSHLSRIKDETDKSKYSLKIVAKKLEELLNEKVSFFDYKNKNVLENKLVLFENTRFFDLDNNKESDCSEELSKYFASFGEIFINDAFGTCHRKNASNYGISKFLPSCNGFLVETEIKMLDNLINNIKKPYVLILGGAKVKDKIGIINNLIDKVDKMIITGGMAYTFLKASGCEIGASLLDENSVDYAKDILKKFGNKIILPVDSYVSKNLLDEKILKRIDNFQKDDIGYDIGNETIKIYEKILKNSRTIFFNGPCGLFENKKYEFGTKKTCEILNKLDANIVIGGGDTVNAAKKYKVVNAYLSTGGGAALMYLEGKELPGIIKE